ncbi:MAG: hypothetical protein M3112_08810 [Actinomycetia bacterium]|nr:hypothetical protein [Actinomycetes bacterium]
MERSSRADSVSAWAIGIGVGLIALQLTWLLGNRLASLRWGPPVGPTIAFAFAIATGIVVSVVSGRRLVRSVNRPQS